MFGRSSSRLNDVRLIPPQDSAGQPHRLFGLFPYMRRSAAVKLPTLDLSSALSPTTLRSRPRSSSLVKVEQVGDRSVEEIIDRSAYVNINADWVNAKGRFYIFLFTASHFTVSNRCMDNSCRTHSLRQGNHRHPTRDDSTSKLDTSKSDIPSSELFLCTLNYKG